MKTNNLAALLIVVALIAGAIIYLDHGKVKNVSENIQAVTLPLPQVSEGEKDKASKFERAKEITTPDGFINTSTSSVQVPITIREFIGKKVILLDIWTYSCINCQRTLPYLNSWYEKYKDKGLLVIGLHTPEFEFEKDYKNVQAAVEKFGIKYPVVLDNDYSTWHAYGNQYWPRHYLIDIDGYIVADHIGEGGYEETERQIQKALAERTDRLGNKNTFVAAPLTEESPLTPTGSPETYFGAMRNEYLANGRQGVEGEQTLVLPKEPELNKLYLGGKWNFLHEYAENKNAGAEIVFRYKAKEVYFVASSESGVKAKIYNDGVLVKDGHAQAIDCRLKGFCGGDDVSSEGEVFIKEDRLYKIIKNAGAEEHVLKIEVEGPGLKAFTFTFG